LTFIIVQLIDRYSIQNFEYSSIRKSAKNHRWQLDEIPTSNSWEYSFSKFLKRRAINKRLRGLYHKAHRQTEHKMIIDRNKILKYRDIKAIKRMLKVMLWEAVPRTPCRQCLQRRAFQLKRRKLKFRWNSHVFQAG
jgi:RNase P subunit RPR2